MHVSLNRTCAFAALSLALCGSASLPFFASEADAGIITAAQLNNYSTQTGTTTGGFVYSRATKLYSGKLTIKNNGQAINGAIVISLNNLPAGITLTNASGDINGTPYILVNGGLSTGASVTVPLSFSNPANTRISFTTAVNQLINGAVNAQAVRALTSPFTIAAVPDTQMYVDDSDAAVTIGFNKQIDWILNNAATQKIAFVTHLGDVVDNGIDTVQWTKAMTALNPLLSQSALPFSIVRGNHDEPGFFLNNIQPTVTQGKPWFIEASPNGLSQAQVFRVEGACFLHVGFQKDPTQAELDWANALLSKPELQGLPVIVSTHDYIDGSGQSVTGRFIWNGFVKNNPMVFMVLNGHTHTEYAVVNHDDANRPVYQMLSDYQDRANGGNGLMRLITIDPSQSKIQVKTFSPYYNKADANFFETDSDSQFEYNVNVKERLAFDTTADFGTEPPAPPLPPLNPIAYNLNATPMVPVPYTHIFQNRRPLVGTETPYAGTVDVQINENNATLNYGGEATLSTDMDDNGSRVHAMLRFDNIIGNGPGQIPPGSTIKSATIVFSATSSTKGKVKMHRMLVPWGEHSTWMDFTPQPVSWTDLNFLNTDTGIYRYINLPSVMVGGGIEPNDVEAASLVDLEFTMPKPVPTPFVLGKYGTTYQAPAWDPNTGAAIPKPAKENLSLTTDGLKDTLQKWVNGEAPNYGWFFEPTSSDGWDFETAEGKQPPALVVTVEGAPLVQ